MFWEKHVQFSSWWLTYYYSFFIWEEGSGLNFYQNKSQLVSSSCISKRHSKFAKPIIHNMTQINSSFVKSFIINDDLYKYKYICKGHALINILHLRVDQHIALHALICICKFTRGRLFKETFTLLLWVIPYFYFSLWHIK